MLSSLFRGLFLHYLDKAFAAGELSFFSAYHHLYEPAAFRRHLAPAHNAGWVVYTKRPFAGPAQVLDYVGRYTHRVAISNNRLVSMDDGTVSFRWSAAAATAQRDDFDRRRVHPPLPIELPGGFHRIRYFGFLGNCHRARKLPLCRELLGMVPAGAATIRRLTTATVSRC